VELAPEWAVSHHWLARALAQLGRGEEAADESARASDLDPRSVRYAYRAAHDAQSVRRYEECLRFLERVHAAAPSHELSRFLEGFSLQRLGRRPEAIAAYRRFLEERPDYVQARFNLAHALMEEGETREAIEEFIRTLELRPDYHEVYYHLARCWRELGDEETARLHQGLWEERPR
jgi:tetratricopeptide (TPR) repeat protein